MQKIDLTKLGGLFTYQDTLDFLQQAYDAPLRGLSSYAGEKYVLQGCTVVGNDVSDGRIVVNGEEMLFVGGNFAASPQIIINTVLADEGFDDGTIKTIYEVKFASLGNTGGFPYSELKRLPFNAGSVGECATKLSEMLKAIIQFEPEVILNGCAVSNIVTPANTLDISAGLVLFAGKLISTPSYSGSFPAYLKEDGSWVTALPGAGLYITFDPHTSQQYKNVLDRALTPAGRLILMETLSDRFDTGTGLGKWEMKGYTLMSDMQNRVPVGLWYDGIAEANVSDAVHNTAGNKGGEKRHTLQTTEQGTFEVRKKHDDGFGVDGGGYVGEVDTQFNGQDVPAGGANASTWGTPLEVSLSAADDGHENRQPFTVIVYAKRI